MVAISHSNQSRSFDSDSSCLHLLDVAIISSFEDHYVEFSSSVSSGLRHQFLGSGTSRAEAGFCGAHDIEIWF